MCAACVCTLFLNSGRWLWTEGGATCRRWWGGGKLMPHSLFPLSKLNDFKHMSFIYFLDCLTSYNTTLLAAVFTGELKYSAGNSKDTWWHRTPHEVCQGRNYIYMQLISMEGQEAPAWITFMCHTGVARRRSGWVAGVQCAGFYGLSSDSSLWLALGNKTLWLNTPKNK